MDNKESKLEKKVKEGVYGQPELKREEKNRYLGEYEERVIRYLTYGQVREPGVYPEITEAVKHPAARKLIISRKVDMEAARDYTSLAAENDLSFKKVDSPDYKGDIALVVASDDAVNVEKRKVLSRYRRLKSKGISDKIIENVGAKLCSKCWQELEEKAPEELVNYRKCSWMDRILGEKCICESD